MTELGRNPAYRMLKALGSSNLALSATESGCCGNLRGTARNGRLCGPFRAPNRTREGRISASFDAVRVFLFVQAQVGSVSQLLRLTAAGDVGCDVADMEMSITRPGRRRGLSRPHQIALAVLGIESGFETADVAVITEQDILGDRLVRPRRQSKRADNFIAEVTSLSAGDLVVHVDHGIGRFVGLRTIEVAGAPHDCLEIHYAGGDKLFLPVENIELLSRYGSEEADVELDRLGGTGWQARKARMKNRIREIAGELIKIAAERHLREAPKLAVAAGLYDEFCARFPYEETDDQQAAINAVLNDLGTGRPMDRLICGDVGFGKTEVALRAAFVAAMNGKQVAVVVPTTLLARQHFKTFTERLRGYPVKVAQASRLVSATELAKTKKGLADGTIDIVVGTHALLGKIDQVQGPRPYRRRRGAAFRRRATRRS